MWTFTRCTSKVRGHEPHQACVHSPARASLTACLRVRAPTPFSVRCLLPLGNNLTSLNSRPCRIAGHSSRRALRAPLLWIWPGQGTWPWGLGVQSGTAAMSVDVHCEVWANLFIRKDTCSAIGLKKQWKWDQGFQRRPPLCLILKLKKKNIKYFSSLEMQYLFKSINQRLVSSYTSVEDWDKECFKFQYDYFTFSNDFCNSHHVSFLRIGNGWQIEGNISKSCVAI